MTKIPSSSGTEGIVRHCGAYDITAILAASYQPQYSEHWLQSLNKQITEGLLKIDGSLNLPVISSLNRGLHTAPVVHTAASRVSPICRPRVVCNLKNRAAIETACASTSFIAIAALIFFWLCKWLKQPPSWRILSLLPCPPGWYLFWDRRLVAISSGLQWVDKDRGLQVLCYLGQK